MIVLNAVETTQHSGSSQVPAAICQRGQDHAADRQDSAVRGRGAAVATARTRPKRWLALLLWIALVSGGGQASGQGGPVRVISPADFVLQPVDVGNSTTKVDFEYDTRVARVLVSVFGSDRLTLPATAKTLHFSTCGVAAGDKPGNKVTMVYEAFNSAGARVGGLGSLDFTLGSDTTKPAVSIVSPKNMALVGPGETVEIVVAGEESRSAPTWQTGMRRLTLVDPALNTQVSPETAQGGCDTKQWKKEHRFRYTVPRNAQAGETFSLKAAAEDWAKNISFATVDLVVQVGFAGVWTTEGRLVKPDQEFGYSIYAAFSFTLHPRTGAVTCGTASQRYCGSARISFLPGRAKDASGGWCHVTFTPAANVFKIVAHGLRQGKELKFLSIKETANVPNRFREDCPGGSIDDAMGVFPVGSILPEGITIAMPLLRNHTTVTKHESSRSGFELDHQVELYAPRQNR